MAQGYAGLPPGPLSAYLGVEAAGREQEFKELQGATQIQGMLARAQAQQKKAAYEQEIAQANTPEKQAQVALKYGGPEGVIKHLDRQAQLAGTLELGKGRLQQQANQLEMQNQFNTARINTIKDEAERRKAADEWQKTYQQGQLDVQRGLLEVRQQLVKSKMAPGDQPLKAPELLHYIDKDANHPPPGTTLNDVIQKGYRLASTQEVNMLLAGRGAESTVNQLDKYVESIWGKEGEDTVTEGMRKRTQAGAAFAIDRWKQSNPDLVSYESFGSGTLAPLIRAIGEKGALAEGDIQRGINLIPKTGNKFGELPDTSVVARQKMKQLRAWFTEALGKGGGGGPPRINSDAEYNALPSGTIFIGPDGKQRRKP